MISRRDAVKLGAVGLVTPSLLSGHPTFAQGDAPEAQLLWTFDHEGVHPDDARTLIRGNGYLLRAQERIEMVHLDTYEPLWTREFQSRIDYIEPILRQDLTGSARPEFIIVHTETTTEVLRSNSGETIISEGRWGSGRYLRHHGNFLLQIYYRMGYGSVNVVDATEGRTLWTTDVNEVGLGNYAEVVGDCIAISQLDGLYIFRLSSGDQITSLPFDQAYTMDAIGNLLLIKESSRVFLYDPQITEEVWTVDFSGYKTLLADANGILVIENDEEAIAIKAESGNVLWSLRLGDPYDQSVTTNDIYGKRSYATVNRNLISVELGDGTDAHYSAITGDVLFHTDILAGYNTGSNHRIFRVESTSYLVDLETATIIHEFSSSPSSQIFTESALVFERDGVIFRLDFQSLEEQIIIEIGTGGYDVIDRLLFVNQFSDPGLKIIDIDSGQRLATLDQGFRNNLKYRYQSTLFIKSEDRLAAFNLQSNELFLEIDWDYWPLAAGYARVELEDGTSVWGDSEWGSPHQIVALSASGAQAWSYSSTAELFIWAFVQSDNADVLWMHDNKLLYAMDCTDGSVMATVAPKLGANALISRFAHDRILLGDPEKSYLYKIP